MSSKIAYSGITKIMKSDSMTISSEMSLFKPVDSNNIEKLANCIEGESKYIAGIGMVLSWQDIKCQMIKNGDYTILKRIKYIIFREKKEMAKIKAILRLAGIDFSKVDI